MEPGAIRDTEPVVEPNVVVPAVIIVSEEGPVTKTVTPVFPLTVVVPLVVKPLLSSATVPNWLVKLIPLSVINPVVVTLKA
jgi:hypothetical protein